MRRHVHNLSEPACQFAFNSEILRVAHPQTPLFARTCETTMYFVRWYLILRPDVGSQSGNQPGSLSIAANRPPVSLVSSLEAKSRV